MIYRYQWEKTVWLFVILAIIWTIVIAFISFVAAQGQDIDSSACLMLQFHWTAYCQEAYGQEINIEAFCAQEENLNSTICIRYEIDVSIMEAMNTSDRILEEYGNKK